MAFTWFNAARNESYHAKHRNAGKKNDQPTTFTRLAGQSANNAFAAAGVGAELQRYATSEAIEDWWREIKLPSRTLTGVVVAPCSESVVVPTSVPPAVQTRRSVEDRMVLWSRAMSAAQIHRVDWIGEQLALDPTYDVFTTEAWDAWRLC